MILLNFGLELMIPPAEAHNYLSVRKKVRKDLCDAGLDKVLHKLKESVQVRR